MEGRKGRECRECKDVDKEEDGNNEKIRRQ